VVAVLPPGARPTHTLYLNVNAEAAPHASLRITTDGVMYLFGGDGTSPLLLTGLSFELGS